MRKLILTLAVVLGITASCTKEYYFTTEVPDIVVTIDNSNTNNANIEINNTSENWQTAASESSADAIASAEAWINTVTAYGEGNDDVDGLNTDVPVATSFGIDAFGFGSTTNSVSNGSSAYNKYNPILNWKTNLNNWSKSVAIQADYFAAIGDIDMRGDDALTTDDDYHHKFSTVTNTLEILHNGVVMTTIETNSKDLYEGNTPAVILAEGNYTWRYSDDGGAVEGISSYLPFTLNGEFRAYGQNVSITADAEANVSYFTIDKVVTDDSNGGWAAGDAVRIAPEGSTSFQILEEELDVLIHVDPVDGEFKSDYWYVYVDPTKKYDFQFDFNDGTKNFTVSNTTVDLTQNFHYNCVFRVLVSDDSNSDVNVASVEFDDATWETKIVEVLVGGINLKEVFFDNAPSGAVSSTWDFSNQNWDEVFIVENDAVTGEPTKWHRGDQLCGYIVPDNGTSAGGFTVVVGTEETIFPNLTDDNAGETLALGLALEYLYNGCIGVYVQFTTGSGATANIVHVRTSAPLYLGESVANQEYLESLGNAGSNAYSIGDTYLAIVESHDGTFGVALVFPHGDSYQVNIYFIENYTSFAEAEVALIDILTSLEK